MARSATKARTAATPTRKARVKGDVIVPDFMLKLMAQVGPTEAARLIGTTPGTLHKARNAKAVSRPIEVASEGIWHKQGYADMERARTEDAAPQPRIEHLGEAIQSPTSEGVSLMLVQVPKGREAIIAKTVEAVGGSVTVQA